MYVARGANVNGESEAGLAERRQSQAAETAAACCRCNGVNQERDPRAPQSKRALEFSAEMLKDQELLVSTLSQQGVSEALIRRQFNKLLEEQSKQLTRQREPVRVSEEPQASRERAPASKDACESRETQDTRKLSATSLLKQRLKREQQDSRSRNNGLQDLVTAAQIIDKSKSQSNSKCDANAPPRFRLNGAQDSSAPESEAFCRAHCLRQPSELPPGGNTRRNVSFNGLENSRRQAAASQLAQAAKSPGDSAARQPSASEPTAACCSAEANIANNYNNNNNIQPSSQAQSPANQQFTPSHQFPDIQEPRVFGGFTYFARKPQSIPQFACNAHQHPQQPPSASDRLQHSQLTPVQPSEYQAKSVCAS